MEKKRSKGVTFWAWVFIILSIMGLVPFVLDFQGAIQSYGTYFGLYSMLSAILYLICGVYLLKLNEMARKAVIWLGIISIILTPLLLKSGVLTGSDSLLRYDSAEFCISFGIILILEFIPIYLFTRPKVKEQFK
jgi:hypothetical protein